MQNGAEKNLPPGSAKERVNVNPEMQASITYMSSGLEYSAGLWEIPPLLLMKIMAVGTLFAVYTLKQLFRTG